MRGVSFSYGGAPVLRDAGLEIPPGRVVCVMGPSGSGKSTLLKLLMRFWDADAGRVEISRTDVRRINTENLRNLEGLVTQDTHLFHDSIENNLRIARPSATREELESACKKASIHDFIMRLPQGYETQVGELGETLSGGERQRLGLARAFLHDAPFLLLDEPTSNLDSLNEAVILKALAEAGERKTVLLVSHRRSTLRVGQVLYAMEDGRVRCV
ncbi:putative ABC transporter ATP-binding protein [bioreactor metagenome]|uniref:Putative ABC transporter ATP-binding protein n=1 Tax=bioreactor metagenome TaxID=1076179 RepID=A0A645GKF6_9ZZZZ